MPTCIPTDAESTYAIQLAEKFPESTLIYPKGSGWEEYVNEQGLEERGWEVDAGTPFDMTRYSQGIRNYLARYPHDVVEAVGCAAPLLVEQIAGNHPTIVRLTRDLMDGVVLGQLVMPEGGGPEIPSKRQRMWDLHMIHQACVSAADIVVGHGKHHQAKSRSMAQIRYVDLPMCVDRCTQPKNEDDQHSRGLTILVVNIDDTSIDGDSLKRDIALSAGDYQTNIQIVVSDYSSDEMSRLMHSAGMVINASRLMMNGRSTLEAFSHGVQVVSFDPADPAKTNWPLLRLGSYLDPKSQSKMVEQKLIYHWLKDPPQCSKALIEFSEKYTWDYRIGDYEAVYERAIAAAIAKGRPQHGW